MSNSNPSTAARSPGALAWSLVGIGLATALLARPPVARSSGARSAGRPVASQQATQTWTVRPADACAGLTLIWEVAPGSLQDLVGSAWRPAPDDSGQAALSLFGARCEGSTIDGVPTGPFTLAALVTDVRPAPGTPGVWPVPPRAAIPVIVGVGGNPVIELFRRHAFEVSEGDVELHVETTGTGARAGLRVAVPGGRVTAQAHLEPPTEPFEAGGAALVATTAGAVAGFHGPESATRRTLGAAAVTTSGDTWISRLGLGPTPDSVTLDTEFVWSFEFWRR